MSISVDPSDTFQICLERHEVLPVERRPLFSFRRCNGREFRAIARAVDSLAGKSSEAACDDLYRAMAIGLLGWSNQTDPSTGESVSFDVTRLEDIIGPLDAAKLLQKRLAESSVTPAEKKS
jgi:hypothetical protein